MKFYDFALIKDSVSISRYLSDMGYDIKHSRFAAKWRDSNDLNCAISKDDKSFYDHAHQQGGSVIDLAMVVENYASAIHAAQGLGNRYHLACKRTTSVAPGDGENGQNDARFIQLRREGYVQDTTYYYKDEEGRTLYSVFRMYNPKTKQKTFLQRGVDHWGLDNTRRVLYNLQKVISSPCVFVVEGEKDADTLNELGFVATTNNGGAKNWDKDFNRFFQGKEVIILHDNDEAGKEHADLVLAELVNAASSIKVLAPSKLPKGDVTDYLTQEGGTKQSLEKMIADTPFFDRKALSAEIAKYTVETARAKNVTPFRNFFEVEEQDQKGNKKLVEKPIQVNALVAECRERFLDFPRRIGSALFDRNPKTGDVVWLPTVDSVMAWISMRSKQTVEWSRCRGAIPQAQFFHALMLAVKQYDGVSKAPHVPVRTDIFYLHDPLPQVPKGTSEHLDKFVSFFAPANNTYAILIRALVMAPMFFGANSPHPSWVIDSIDGKGVGKTTLVKMLAELYNEIPIDIDAQALKADLTSTIKRLISSEGRSRRIALLDNVQGTFRCSNLARLITTATLSGIAPYGHSEESRRNDITYIITSNAASLDDDIAQRSYMIKLRKSPRNALWEREVRSYIARYRSYIFAEIVELLSNPLVKIEVARTRYPEFEQAVLGGACRTTEEYESVVKSIISDYDATNATNDRAQEVQDVFRDAILNYCALPGLQDAPITFITTGAVSHIIANSDTLRLAHINKTEIAEMIQSRNLSCFSRTVQVVRDDKKKSRRGWLWIGSETIVETQMYDTYLLSVVKEKLDMRFIGKHKFMYEGCEDE